MYSSLDDVCEQVTCFANFRSKNLTTVDYIPAHFQHPLFELLHGKYLIPLISNVRLILFQARKRAKIRNRYNQAPHLAQDTNGKVTSQLDITNESHEDSPFPAGDHKAPINRRAQRHSKYKTEQKHKKSTKEVPPWNGLTTVDYIPAYFQQPPLDQTNVTARKLFDPFNI